MIDPKDWMPADGLTLEPNALAAVKEAHRNLALTAGPGAGKTEMLAQRADFLLRTGLCPYPRRILAISFKVDAAHNLKERVRRRCGPALAARLDSHTFHAFAKGIIDRFRPALSPLNTLDPDYTVGEKRVHRRQITFDEMVPLAMEILERNTLVLEALRQTYSHVFLDEFQDCNEHQYRLVRCAFYGTDVLLTAVGDTKQRIMGYAGAVEGIFENFKTDFHANSLNMYQNFRSMPRLRRMQNAMVKIMDPPAAVEDEEIKGSSGEIHVLDFDSSPAEAVSLADSIATWIHDEEVPASDIAVLAANRVEQYTEHLMLELASRGIAYRNEQKLQDLSAEPIAKLIIDFLVVLMGDREPEANQRLLQLLQGGGEEDDERERSRLNWQAYIGACRSANAHMLRNANDTGLLKQIITDLFERLGKERLTALAPSYQYGSVMFDQVDKTFHQLQAMRNEGIDWLDAAKRFSEDSAVRIMTIHKSKGLEFDTVVILGVENETFFGAIESSRPVFFVGISRAKRRLVLTFASKRPRPNGWSQRWSQFRTRHKEFLGYALCE